MTKQLMAAVAMVLIAGSVSVPAQTTTKTSKTQKRVVKHVESATEREIRELREQMQSQQAQINALKSQNAEKDAKLATAAADAQSANAAAATATATAQSVSSSVQANADAVSTLNSTVNDLKASNSGLAQTISDTKKDLTEKIESPLAIHYKGVTITPVAFFAAESVYRSRATASDIATPFNSTPFMNSGQAHVSEFNFSGRQSRLGGLFEGNAGTFKLAGYFEADFLSAGVTSNSNQSNSYTLRQRVIYGQAATQSGFTVSGGQMWSLVTETKKGTDNRTENLPMTVDPNYHVGFSWARQPAIRVQQKIGGLTAALSLEEAQIIYSATNANANFFLGNAGTGGGLYNATANYSDNIAPDIIVKFAYDTKHYGHYEVGGLTRFFRDRYYPNQTLATPSASGAQNDTKVGGGFLANARFPVTHFADIGIHTLGGTGVGRYGTSTLPDTTVHPDGTLAPIKAYQGLFSVELHPTKKLDIFGYAGGEYAQRTVYLSTVGTDAGKLVGYAPVSVATSGCNTETLPSVPTSGLGSIGTAGGAPYDPSASCGAATRAVLEGTAGFTYRVYSNPRFGRLQYQGVYSYLKREAWTGLSGAPNATNNMVFTGMRYYIP
ncbi:hypothetical protein [Granulicella arctica]|uniref:Uncharacterized protein n=1 Tax=Granulicella arctica TaxID=940613 RepID=A0A7Y9TU26_9BACT|nr:hypothetical protein [Granulicella arctica]NYF80518.1 hypothetical protein [Granulicella arctica]